jgi:hypothetical protein
MTEQYPEPTDDETPDGTQLPTADDLPDEEGDAGVEDDGTEEWYGEDPMDEVPD